MIFLGELEQRLSRLRLDVGGVDDRQPTGFQAFGGDQMQHLKGRRRGVLGILVIGHQGATHVGGDDLRRPEVFAGKG